MRTNLRVLVLATLLAWVSETGHAGPVGPLTTFTAGTPAKAAEVNGNFNAVSTAVNDNDARITALQSTVGPAGNIVLVPSTATAGNILKGTAPFVHNFGTDNVFVGMNSGNLTMSGMQNAASGANALQNNTTGGRNTASGANALLLNTTGSMNTACGTQALIQNTTGFANTASGESALAGNTTGVGNTASGQTALANHTTGNFNTASGASALFNSTTGSGNIAIGVNAGGNLTTGDNNIDIGNAGVAAEANTIRIGTGGTQTATFIAGISGVTTIGAAVPVVVDTNGQLGTVSSSRRFKDDIADMGAASSGLMKLRPVTFRYKADKNKKGRALQYGLVAEEVAEVNPALVAHSADGRIETVYYQFLAPMLLNEYQKQQRTIDAQAAELTKQKLEIADLRRKTARVAELEKQTGRIVALLGQLEGTGMIAGGH